MSLAILPVQLANGTWLWWKPFERRSTVMGPTRLDIRWENRSIDASNAVDEIDQCPPFTNR